MKKRIVSKEEAINHLKNIMSDNGNYEHDYIFSKEFGIVLACADFFVGGEDEVYRYLWQQKKRKSKKNKTIDEIANDLNISEYKAECLIKKFTELEIVRLQDIFE